MVENGLIIAGSPDTVAERVASASKELKIGNFLAILHVGNMPDELTRRNITMFGEKVIPKIRGLWSDGNYEHKWWASGVQPRPAAGAMNQ
jgi:hypothetical protein